MWRLKGETLQRLVKWREHFTIGEIDRVVLAKKYVPDRSETSSHLLTFDGKISWRTYYSQLHGITEAN